MTADQLPLWMAHNQKGDPNNVEPWIPELLKILATGLGDAGLTGCSVQSAQRSMRVRLRRVDRVPKVFIKAILTVFKQLIAKYT